MIAADMVTGEITPSSIRGLDHRTVWRWHFYAGLFCIPFVLWLATTGTIFLFKPQIEGFLDRPYNHLVIAQRATVNDQVQAALTAVPGSTLDSYELPASATAAAQVLVDKGRSSSAFISIPSRSPSSKSIMRTIASKT